MPMSFEDLFEEIKRQYDILNLVSQYVKLKRVGKNYVGLCPFHAEKTPSFTVNPEKQIFKCFGCGASGDVISFYMKIKGLDFRSALLELAERAGLEIKTLPFKEKKRERELVELNFKVAKIYQNFLHTHPLGDKAREYLKKRGLSEETWENFFLGYAPPEGRVLAGLLRASQFDMEQAIEAGLLKKMDDGSYLDLFRDRLVIPILNEKGECVGFAGRALSPDVEPKYLNSPETRLFKKSEILYGLFQSKEFIKKERSLYLVEGYFDYLSLWERGIKNVVATCGTALTERHVQKICSYAEDIYLFFDGDKAGKKAALRAISLFSKKNRLPQVINLPSEEDPDSFVQKFTKEQSEQLKEKLKELTLSAPAFAYYTLKHEFPSHPSKVFQELVELFSEIDDPLLEQEVCRELAFYLELPEGDIRRSLRKNKKSQPIQDKTSLMEEIKKEEGFLKIIAQYLVSYPEEIPSLEEVGLRELLENFEEGPYQRFLLQLLELKPKEESQILSIPSPDFQELLSDLLFSPPFEDKKEVQEQIKRFILLERKKREMKKMAESIKFFEKMGKREEIERILFNMKKAMTYRGISEI